MMRNRRTLAMVGLFGFAVGVIWFTSASAPGQVVVQFQPGGGMMPVGKKAKSDGTTTAQFSAVKLIENTIYRDYIRASRDAILGKAYNDAITALQKILDTKEDSYVLLREKNDAGQEISRWASAKFAANQLIGSMPDEGLDVYEQRFGAKAQALLREAKETGNQDMLADAAHRYFHTKAGVEANERLATMLLDRSQFFLAALRFGRLFKLNAERHPVADMTLFKAALSHRRSGDLKSATELWRKLEDRIEAKGGIRVGEQLLTLNQLRNFFQDDRVVVTFGLSDWPMIRGDKSNNAQAIGGAPLMDTAEWTRKLLMDNDPNLPEDDYHEREKTTKARLDDILKVESNTVVMPGFFPITANGYAVFRSYYDVRCVALRELKLSISGSEDLTFKAGDTVWRSHMNGSAVNLLTDKDLSKIVAPWLTNYMTHPGFANLVFENTTIGSLSSDHQFAYAVDDLAIPPPDYLMQQANQFGMGYQQSMLPEKIKPLVMENSLWAFRLQNGSSAWSLGRTSQDPRGSDRPKDEFSDSHFLGAPISVGGKLYVLNEKHSGAVGDAE